MKHAAPIITTIAGAIGSFGLVFGLGSLYIASSDAEPPMVNLTELRTVDGYDYPVCSEEDCSDQPGQVGIWCSKRSGNCYLELGEEATFLINDDTVTTN